MKKNIYISILLLACTGSAYSMDDKCPEPQEIYTEVTSNRKEYDRTATIDLAQYTPLVNLTLKKNNGTFYQFGWCVSEDSDPCHSLREHQPDVESLQHTDLALKLATTMYVRLGDFSLYGFCNVIRENKKEILDIIDQAASVHMDLDGCSTDDIDDPFVDAPTPNIKPAQQPSFVKRFFKPNSFAFGSLTTALVMGSIYALPKLYAWWRA